MVSAISSPSLTTERKIFFFRIDIGHTASGHPIPFDPIPVLRQIDTLSWTPTGRYFEDNDSKITCCWVDNINAPQKIRLGNIRRSELPQVEEAGVLTPLRIPLDSGISDQTHIVFFDNNIVGADFNFYGPRISRLSDYFQQKAQHLFPQIIFFESLLKRDVLEELEKFGDIRLFNIKLHASFVSVISRADRDLGNAFEAAARVGEAEELEVILNPARYSQGTLSNRLLSIAKQLVPLDILRSALSRFVVRGYNEETERIETLDLLNDKLISKKRIILLDSRSRALDPQSAFDAIQEAYVELHDELSIAAGIQI